MCYSLALTETDLDVAAAWVLAGDKALEAVDLLDPNRK
jgi:hypothetical protein